MSLQPAPAEHPPSLAAQGLTDPARVPAAACPVRVALWLVLALAFLLDIRGIGWGLPAGEKAWDYDEIVPFQVAGALQRGTANSWPLKYPPLQSWLLVLPCRLAVTLADSGALGDIGRETASFLAIRLVSVLMGVLAVALVYLAGREAMPRQAAVLAAAVFACLPTVVFYSKLGNLDIPYTFWFALALLFLLRLLQRHRLGDYLGFALAAAASVLTKDQAYGLFVVAPPLLLVSLRRHEAAAGRPRNPFRLLLDRRILLAVAGGALLFLLVHDVVRDPGRLVRHVRHITGSASRGYQLFPANLRGEAQNLVLIGANLLFTTGWPMALAAVGGLVLALARRRDEGSRLLLAALALALSYYGFFLAVILYSYERFLLPVGLVLSLLAGHFLWALGGVRRARWIAAPVVAVVLVHAGLRGAAMDRRMIGDSRQRVEEWLVLHMGPLEQAMATGDAQMSPRISTLRWKQLLRRGRSVLHALPTDWLVVNVSEAESREAGRLGFYRDLLEYGNEFEYSFRLRYRPGERLLDFRGVSGSLVFASPDLAVFARPADPALGGATQPEAGQPSRTDPAAVAAALARRRGDHAMACTLDERALARAPRDRLATLGRGEDARLGGEPEGARYFFERAAGLDPGWAAPWLGLARLELDQGRPERAAEHARTATELLPDSPGAWLVLAQAERRSGRGASSVVALERAAELAELAGDPQALSRIARAQRELGAGARALGTLRLARGLRAEPGETPEGRNLVRYLRDEGRFAEAGSLEREMIDVAP